MMASLNIVQPQNVLAVDARRMLRVPRTETDLQVGDTVMLRCGGPEMVVISITSDGVIAGWDNGTSFGSFGPYRLEELVRLESV